MLVTGGGGSNGRNTEIFVEGAETWTLLDAGANLPTWTWGLAVMSVDNTVLAIGLFCHVFFLAISYLYIHTGGRAGGIYSTLIFNFDINNQTWNQVGNLKVGRMEHAVTVVNSSDIVCGTTPWSTTTPGAA